MPLNYGKVSEYKEKKKKEKTTGNTGKTTSSTPKDNGAGSTYRSKVGSIDSTTAKKRYNDYSLQNQSRDNMARNGRAITNDIINRIDPRSTGERELSYAESRLKAATQNANKTDAMLPGFNPNASNEYEAAYARFKTAKKLYGDPKAAERQATAYAKQAEKDKFIEGANQMSFQNLLDTINSGYLTSEQKKWGEEILRNKATSGEAKSRAKYYTDEANKLESELAERYATGYDGTPESGYLYGQSLKMVDNLRNIARQYTERGWTAERLELGDEARNSPTFEQDYMMIPNKVYNEQYRALFGLDSDDEMQTKTQIAARRHRDVMTDEEKKTYSAIYNTRGPGEANNYYEALTYELDQRLQDKKTAEFNEMLNTSREEHKNDRSRGTISSRADALKANMTEGQRAVANSNAAFAPATPGGIGREIGWFAQARANNVASGIGALDALWQGVTNRDGRPVNWNTASFTPHTVSQTIQENQLAQIDSPVGKFAYQTAGSMADSLVVMGATLLGVPGATAILGGAAATDSMLKAKERGATDSQALTVGLLSGTAETLFEQVSLEKLLTAGTPATLKEVLKNMFLRQGVTEASEEFFTTIANTISDALLMGDKSELRTNIRQYVEQGYSQSDAERLGAINWFKDLAMDALGGFVSGAIFGGFEQGISYGGYRGALNNIQNAEDTGAAIDTYQQNLGRVLDENGNVRKDSTNAAKQLQETYQRTMERLTDRSTEYEEISRGIDRQVESGEMSAAEAETAKAFVEFAMGEQAYNQKAQEKRAAEFEEKARGLVQNMAEKSTATISSAQSVVENYDSSLANPSEYFGAFRYYEEMGQQARAKGTNDFSEVWKNDERYSSAITQAAAMTAFSAGYTTAAPVSKIMQIEERGTGTLTYSDEALKQLAKNVKNVNDAIELLSAVAKKTGFTVKLDESMSDTENAKFVANMMTIAVNPRANILAGVFHEAGHAVQRFNPQAYAQLKSDMISWYAQTQGMTNMDQMLASYAKAYSGYSRDALEIEMTNDAFGSLFNREDAAQDLANWLTENKTEAERKSFVEKLTDLIDRIVNWVKNLVNLDGVSPVQKRTVNMQAEQAKAFRQMFLDALDDASLAAQEATEYRMDVEADRFDSTAASKSMIDFSLNVSTLNYAAKYTAEDEESAARLKTLRDILQELWKIEQVIKTGEGKTSHSIHDINKYLESNRAVHRQLLDVQRRANEAGITCDFVTPIGKAVKVEGKSVAPGLKGLPIEYVEAAEGSSKYVERTSNKYRHEGYKFTAFKRTLPQMFLDSVPHNVREMIRTDLVKAVEDAYEKGTGSEILKDINKAFPSVRELKSVGGQSTRANINNKTMKGVQAPLRSAEKTVMALNLNSACPMFTIGNHGCYLDACYLTQMANGATGTNLFRTAWYTGELLQLNEDAIQTMRDLGGLRINGVGDTIMDNKSQLVDVLKHAAMRNLPVKIITKQAATFDVLSEAKKAGVDLSQVSVQPSMDNLWIPAALDDVYGAGVRGDTQLADTVRKGNFDAAMEAYDEFFGRATKVVDGILYRKYGFSPEQVQKMMDRAQKEYPEVTVTPRYVVCTPEEIAEIALNKNKFVVNGGAIIQTLMHGKVPAGCISDYGTTIVNFGGLRHVIERRNGVWDFYGATVSYATKPVLDADGNQLYTKKGKARTTKIKRNGQYVTIVKRASGKNSPYQAVLDYVNSTLEDGTPRFSDMEKAKIWFTLKETMCCQASESKDACAGCSSLCANGATLANVKARQSDTLETVEEGDVLPDWVEKMETVGTDYSRTVEDINDEYMSAVESGDEETQQRLVDEAAMLAGAISENGRPVQLYHGTPHFGFTKFDLNRMRDRISIFLTSVLDVASTYSGETDARHIRDEEINVADMSLDDVVKTWNKHFHLDDWTGYKVANPREMQKRLRKILDDIHDSAEKAKKFLDNKALIDYLGELADINNSPSDKNAAIEMLGAIAEFSLARNADDLRAAMGKLVGARNGIFANSIHELLSSSTGAYKIMEKAETAIDFMENLDTPGVWNGRDTYRTEDEFRHMLEYELSFGNEKGNYGLFAFANNILDIDAGGEEWNRISWLPQEVQEAKRKYNEALKKIKDLEKKYPRGADLDEDDPDLIAYSEAEMARDKYLAELESLGEELGEYGMSLRGSKTRAIAAWAKANGYDAVRIRNVVDNGEYVEDYVEGDVYIVFNPAAVKSSDPITYDEDGNVIPLTERFNLTEQDIRWSRTIEEINDEYMTAVESGDTEAQERMVKEAAMSAGYTSPMLYHGTLSFGFTSIDPRAGDDRVSFFATDSLDIAKTYSFDKGIRELTDRLPFTERDLRTYDRKGYETGYSADPKILTYLDKLGIEYSIAKDQWGADVIRVPAWDSSFNDGRYTYQTKFKGPINSVAYELHNRYFGTNVFHLAFGVAPEAAGTYRLYANTDGFLEVDANQSNWDSIPFSIGDKSKTTTREIAKYAKENNYPGVIIKNVYDNGGKTKSRRIPSGNIYVFFNPASQVKSADPITYDDDGNVIPLTERFNLNKDDIRWSRTVDDWLEDLSIDDIIEEQESAPKKSKRRIDEVNKRLKEIGLQFNGTSVAAWTDEKINKYLGGDYYGSSNPNYAQAHIAYMTPQQYLNLTMGSNTATVDRIQKESSEYGPVDFNRLGDSDPIRLYIDKGKNGARVVGHEGRHRMMLLGQAGFSKVPVLLFDSSDKYGKVTLTNYTLRPQKFYDTGFISKGRNVVVDEAIPFSQGNRELIIQKFGSGNTEADVSYSKSESTSLTDTERRTLEKRVREAERNAAKEKQRAEHFKHEMTLTPQFTPDAAQITELANEIATSFGESSMDTATIEQNLRDIFTHINEAKSSGKTARADAALSLAQDVATRVVDSTIGEFLGVSVNSKIMRDDVIAMETNAIMDRILQTRMAKSTKADKWNAKLQAARKALSETETYASREAKRADALENELAAYKQKMADKIAFIRAKADADHAFNRQAYEQRIARVRAQRDIALREQKEYYKGRIGELSEQKRVAKIMPKVKKEVDALRKMLLSPDEKTYKYVPDIVRGAVADFLSCVDFVTRTMAETGAEMKSDAREVTKLDAIRKLAERAKDMQNGNVDDDYFLDLPSDTIEVIDLLRDRVTGLVNVLQEAQRMGWVDEEIHVRTADSTTLEIIRKLARTINSAVTNINRNYVQGRFAHVDEGAENTIRYLDGVKRAEKYSKTLGNSLLWSMATPYYAFKRFGEGGSAIFENLGAGLAQFAKNVNTILDFVDETFTRAEQREWGKQLVTVDVTNAKGEAQKLTMTANQLMSLYCLSRREAAQNHLYVGGITLQETKAGKTAITQEQAVHLTPEALSDAFDQLSDRQKEVAQKLQEFMSTTGSDWGNEVSMKRWGVNAFEEKFYFPMKTSDNGRATLKANDDDASSLYGMVNQGFTKHLQANANNALVIDDIFSVFTDHSANMAKYNAMVLPLLDAMKWYNWTNRADTMSSDGNLNRNDISVKGAIKEAFGTGATQYFRQFMADLNSAKSEGGAGFTLGQRMLSNYKAAAVAANLRVALLQPTAFFRAGMILSPTDLTRGAAMPGGLKEMMKYSGIAQWKDLGFYDTDIGRSVRRQIQGEENKAGEIRNKVVDKSLWLAEKGDQITWAAIWNACKIEQQRQNKGVSYEDLMKLTEKRFNEVIFATQVFDSTLSRSEVMRKRDPYHKIITAFMSEPTLSYNMVLDKFMQYSVDVQKLGKGQAWKKNGGMITRSLAVYAVTNLVAALAESVVDAYRDEDDEPWLEKFLDALFGDWAEVKDTGSALKALYSGNFMSDMTVIGKIPLAKEVISLIQGYEIGGRMDTQAIQSVANMIKIWDEKISIFTGKMSEKDATKATWYGNMTLYGAIYKSLQALSQFSGIPMYNFMRDIGPGWNMTIGALTGFKLDTYKTATERARESMKAEHGMTDEEEQVAIDYELDKDFMERYYTKVYENLGTTPQKAGVPLDVFAEYSKQKREAGASKRDDICKIIDSMSIDKNTKDKLYYIAGFAASKINEAPWH